MPDILRELSVVTVNMAMVRRILEWTPERSNVENEQAYLDRLALAEYIDVLRDELRNTQDAQREAEQEVEHLTKVINDLTDEEA